MTFDKNRLLYCEFIKQIAKIISKSKTKVQTNNKYNIYFSHYLHLIVKPLKLFTLPR